MKTIITQIDAVKNKIKVAMEIFSLNVFLERRVRELNIEKHTLVKE